MRVILHLLTFERCTQAGSVDEMDLRARTVTKFRQKFRNLDKVHPRNICKQMLVGLRPRGPFYVAMTCWG